MVQPICVRSCHVFRDYSSQRQYLVNVGEAHGKVVLVGILDFRR
jgi:hypothetical protein